MMRRSRSVNFSVKPPTRRLMASPQAYWRIGSSQMPTLFALSGLEQLRHG
jgi:hypothetical protein